MHIPYIPKDKFKKGLHPAKQFPGYFKKTNFSDFFEKLRQSHFEFSKFYDVSTFLYSAKTSEYKDDKLVKLISCIERVMSEVKHEHPKAWFSKRKNNELECLVDNKSIEKVRENLSNLFDKYSNNHGSAKKLEYFFINHINYKNKLKIIKAFRFCKKEGGYDVPQVLKHGDKKEIKESLRRISGIIYEIRSDYVHSATFFPLRAKEGESHQVYLSRKKKKFIMIGMNIGTFYNIVEEGIFSYFGLTK